MKYYINIEADTNDGDYIQKLSEINEETLELIKPVIQAIENFEPYNGIEASYMSSGYWVHDHNYPNGEYRRDDLGEKSSYELYGHIQGFDTFDELVPYGGNGIHSITEIVLLEVNNVEKLF